MRLKGGSGGDHQGALGIGCATGLLVAAEGAAVAPGNFKIGAAEIVAREIAERGGRAIAVGVVGHAGEM